MLRFAFIMMISTPLSLRRCGERPTVDSLVNDRLAEIPAGMLSGHCGEIVRGDGIFDCVDEHSRLAARCLLQARQRCVPVQAELWERTPDGEVRLVFVVVPDEDGDCVTEVFTDNTLAQGQTSIRYRLDHLEQRACFGVSWRATELDWWRVQPDDRVVRPPR